MYTTRTFKMQLKSESIVKSMWKATILDGDEEDNGPFSLSTSGGIMEPGSSIEVAVKFSPIEVEKANRKLIITVEDSDPKAEKIDITLKGSVERPLCHFELQPSK